MDKTSEFKSPIIVGVTVAVAMALSIAGLAYLVSPPSSNLSSSASTSLSSTNTSASLPLGCSTSQDEGYYSGTLVVGTTSPAIVCVEFYWFNSSAPAFAGNVMSLFQIEGYTLGGPLGTRDGYPMNGASNFTVNVSQSQLVLGGPTNANEGAVVAYSITAKSGASGTYQFLVNGGGEWLGATGAENCGPNGEFVAINLVAGNGQPNYVYTGPALCGSVEVTTVSGMTNSTQQSFSIPGVNYRIPGGILLYRIVSLTNATR